MTKALQNAIDEANREKGVAYPQIGTYITFTRGFGLPDDLRIGVIINKNGGVTSLCRARCRDFKKHLARERKARNGD